MTDKVRIDKFLWAVRLFKTRSQASEAVKKGKVLVNNQTVKSSRNVSINDEISVKDHIIFRKYKILDLIEKRVGAKLVPQYITEITDEDELFKLKMYFQVQKTQYKREKPGRPTKKDRRDIDKFLGKF